MPKYLVKVDPKNNIVKSINRYREYTTEEGYIGNNNFLIEANTKEKIYKKLNYFIGIERKKYQVINKANAQKTTAVLLDQEKGQNEISAQM